jgi:hypothetical protein
MRRIELGLDGRSTTVLDPAVNGLPGWVIGSGLGLASFVLYLVNLDQPSDNPDEFYHMLAARGLLETGEPRIAEGLYWRGYLYTQLVAASFALFGESLIAARLPSVLATVAIVLVLFFWTRREAGSVAGALVAGLYAVSPFAVEIAQFCRFYALQTLAFLVTTWLVVEASARTTRPATRATHLLGAAGLAALAVHLQPASYLGLASLAVWAGPVLVLRLLARSELAWTVRLSWLLGGALLAAGGFAFALASGRLGELWTLYREPQLFNLPLKEQYWFYYIWYLLLYPTLWTAIGVAAVLAIVRAPLLGGVATVVFAVSFVLVSFGGSKGLRYVAYAQPFLFILWGLAIATLLPFLGSAGRRLVEGLEAALTELGRMARPVSRILIGGAVSTLVLANPFWLRTASMLADLPLGPETPDTDWRRTTPVLVPLLAETAVVVNTEELGPLFYFDRHDILFNPSKLGELPVENRVDFARDPRTGRPVIGSLAALEKVIRCTPSGLFLTPALHWRRPYLATPEAVALLEKFAEPVEMPAGSHVHAYRWRHEPSEADAICRTLPLPTTRESR